MTRGTMRKVDNGRFARKILKKREIIANGRLSRRGVRTVEKGLGYERKSITEICKKGNGEEDLRVRGGR